MNTVNNSSLIKRLSQEYDAPKERLTASRKSPAYMIYQEILNSAEEDSVLMDLISNLESSNNRQKSIYNINKRLHWILRTKLNETPIPLSALLKASLVIDTNTPLPRLKIEKYLDSLIENLLADETKREENNSTYNFT